MQKVQKTYTPEFKRETVHLAQTGGKPIAQVARELGISDTSIHQLRKELTEHGPEAFPGSGHQTAQEEEVRHLKRAQARSTIFEYIECFYNRTRRHSTLQYMSLLMYEQLMC